MKYLLLIVLLVAAVITAGCVGGNQNTPVTPTPQIVYTTVFVTPTPTPNPSPTTPICEHKCTDTCLLDYEICAYEKLKKEGITDCISCIGNYNNPVYPQCHTIARYNAEIRAKNECMGFTPTPTTR